MRPSAAEPVRWLANRQPPITDADLGSRTVSALQWSYGGAVVRALAQLVVQLLLARLLGPEAFGQATAALLVLGIGWILSEGGFGAALVQKPEITSKDVGYALGWVLLLSGTAGAVVIASAEWLARWMGDADLAPFLMVCGALIPVQAVSNIPISLMRRELDMRRAQFISMGSYLVAYCAVGLPLAWAGAGAWSLVLALGLYSLLNAVGSYAVVRHTLRPRLSGDKAVARFGMNITGTNAANWAIENVDRLLINRFWGSTALGEYGAASTLSRAPVNFLVGSMQSVTFASASRLQDDLPRMARSYLALLALITLVTGPLFALLAVHAETIVHVAYGQRWERSAPLFVAFCVGLPFYALLSVTGPLLWAVGAVRQEMCIQMVGAVLIGVGFLALSGTSLEQAVWLIPLAYAVRAGSVYLVLSARLALDHRKTLRAVAGGLFLTLVVLAACALANRWLEPLAAAITSSALAPVLCWAALRTCPQWLLSPDLVSLLRNRAADSALLAWLCRLVGLVAR